MSRPARARGSRHVRGRKKNGSMRRLESGTSSIALPGLEGCGSAAEPRAGHWIERGPWKRLMVFSGRSHPELAQLIGEQLGVEGGEVTLKTFAHDEQYR